MDDILARPLLYLLGDKTAKVLAAALELDTVGDLLDHFPRRYEERGKLTPLRDLVIGEDVTVQAEVFQVTGRWLDKKRHKLDVVLTDGPSRLTVTFFNRHYLQHKLAKGSQALFAGKVEVFGNTRRLTNPQVNFHEEDDFAGGLLPIYPASAKLPTWNLRRAVKTVLNFIGELPDPLPPPLRAEHRLPGLLEAYQRIHRPSSFADVEVASRRLRWDEALVVQVALAQRRRAVERQTAVPRPVRTDGLLAAFDRALPFELTAGQRAIGQTVEADLARTYPMHRLLQGEVGSGKTVVALRAMLAVIDAGGQAALLAPTEVLATQHERSLRAMLGSLGSAGELGSADEATRIVLLTGSQSAATRRVAGAAIADGSAGMVVGTHALLSPSTEFAELGLVVVDEQHRFGVEQRDTLRAKAEERGGTPPHLLVMTATPIPRTVAMTVFGDLDTSELTELPKGRQPIRSHVAEPRWHERIWAKIRDEVANGHQAFVVCPRIGDDPSATTAATTTAASNTADGDTDEIDPDDAPLDDAGADEQRRPPLAVLEVLPILTGGPLAGLRVAALHGRLPAEEKERVMSRFTAGELDVLVATTMVEVGVDVPNATVMAVLDADRFGVSQLHQLRGRVGRGSAVSWCLLHTDAAPDTAARQRVEAVAATLDGAELARLDLRERREGDVLGTAQSGRRRSLKLLDLLRDEDLLHQARGEATAILDQDPELAGHPILAGVLARRLDEQQAAYLEKG